MTPSKAAAMRINVVSSPKPAANCTPIDRPDSLCLKGKEIEGEKKGGWEGETGDGMEVKE